MRAPLLAALALLAACGPIPRAEAERQCYERARMAMQPRGEVRMGMNSELGAVAGFEIAVSSDYIQGRDPAQVYDSCVYQRSGEMPSRPLYDLLTPGRGIAP